MAQKHSSRSDKAAYMASRFEPGKAAPAKAPEPEAQPRPDAQRQQPAVAGQQTSSNAQTETQRKWHDLPVWRSSTNALRRHRFAAPAFSFSNPVYLD